MKDRIQILGEYFGYPQCCIDAYRNSKVTQIAAKHLADGFVPCDECAKKANEKFFGSFSALITNRICPTPFPIDMQGDTMNYVAVHAAQRG